MIRFVKKKYNKTSGLLLAKTPIEANHLFRYNKSSLKSDLFGKEVPHMAKMKRTTISFPDDLTERIFELRKDDRFVRCSYSELIRRLTEKGLAILDKERVGEAG